MGVRRKRMIGKMIKAAIVMSLAVSLVACSSKGGRRSGSEMGVGDTVQFYGTDLSPEQERDLLAKRTYYFAYDSSNVSDEDTLSIYAHAKKLIESPRSKVRVEGHTDKRGSREYNIALGDRRAQSVANILMLKGVPQDQISVVSYGKEKPAAHGDSEEAWSQNRRVVMVYEVE